MSFLKKLRRFLSGDWWKGLAVLTTAAGIVVGGVLTYGVFRLTQSNLDLAESNLQETSWSQTANIRTRLELLIPVIAGKPELEGSWYVKLQMANYGPAAAGGFLVRLFTRDGGLLQIDDVQVYDSSLREVEKEDPFLVSVEFGTEAGIDDVIEVNVTFLPQGETLDVVAIVRPRADLVEYARELDSRSMLSMRDPSLWYMPSTYARSDYLENCAFDLQQGWGDHIIFSGLLWGPQRPFYESGGLACPPASS